MKLSIVVPTLNEAANIESCVASAFALQTGWGDATEVVVADGGSVDGCPELAERAGASVVASEPGRGRQLRLGVEAATGDLMLMLHADATLAPEAGRQLADAVHTGGARCGAFRQLIEAEGALFRCLESANAFRARRLGVPYGDQAIFVGRELLDAVGGVPDEPIMEDVVLMRRVRRHAWPILLPGPLRVSPRRWRERGVVRQTLRNWSLLTAYRLGVSPRRLARFYAPHGE